MIAVTVVNKATAASTAIQQSDIALTNASVVQVGLRSSQVKGMRRVGDDLVITAQSGEVLTIRSFFKSFLKGVNNDLVLEDDKGGLWLTSLSGGEGELVVGYTPIDSIEPLLLHESDTGGILPWLIGGLGALLLAGGAGGGGGSGPAPDTTPPAAPVFDVKSDAAGRAVVTGRAEAGSTVVVRFPDGTSASVTAGGDGSFTVVSASAQPSGVIIAQATDAAGNTGPTATVPFTDTTGPAAPILSVTSNADGSVTVTGTAEPGSTVQIRHPDGTTVAVVAGPDGSFTETSGPNQPSGTVTAAATDVAGNVGGTTTVGYTENTPPSAPTVNPTNGHTITGTAEPGSVVTVTDSRGTVIGSATTAPDGTYTITPTNPPADGSVLTVVATDPAGNQSPPTTAVVDGVVPVIAVAIVNDANNDGFINASERGEDVAVKVTLVSGAAVGDVISATNGTTTSTVTLRATDVANGYVNFRFPNPAEGATINISVTSTDRAGNVSTPASTDSAQMDTTAPVRPTTPASYADNVGTVQNPASTAATTDDTTPGISIGTVPTGTTPTLYVDGVQVPATYNPTTGTLTPTTPLAEGPHVITYTVTDPAGNESPPSEPIGVTVDTTAPVKPATPASYEDNVGTVQNPTSTAPTTDDPTPGINIGTVPSGTTPTLYVDGVQVPATYNPTTGTLTPTTPLAEGPHVITYTVTDPAGNESPPSEPIGVTVDTTAPVKPATPSSYEDNVGTVQNPTSTAPTTDDATPGINIGTVPAGTTPTLYVDGVQVPATYSPTTGTLTPTTPLAEGPHVITYTVTDPAGNESPPSEPIAVTVDTTAPIKPATPSSYADNVGTVQDSASTALTTDDQTPGINIGMVPSGTTPTLYVDGVKVPATYDPVAGTLTPTTPLTDGLHAITYTLTDPAGNESGQSGSLPLTIDTGAPGAPAAPTTYADNVGTVQSPASTAATTDDTTPGINIGTVPTGTTPTLYVDGVKVPATYDPVAGTLTPTTPLTDGPHAITYTLTDPAGNESGQSGSLPLTIDTGAPSAPAAPTSYADNVGTVQDPASTALTTDDQTPGINIGTVPAGTTPTLYVDGVAVPATYDPVAGTLTPTTALTDGPHAITYTLTDPAGNESGQSGSLPLTIDTGAPSAPAAPTTYADNVGTVQDPASTALTTDDQTPGINIGTVPAGTTPTLYVDGVAVPATYDPVAGTLTPITALADGPHAITYTLTDAAGNESGQSGSLPLTIDTGAPSAPAAPTTYADNVGTVQDLASTALTTDDQTPGINIGTVPAGTTPALYVDGVQVPATYDPVAGTLTPTTPLTDGLHAITYTLTDPAGNESGQSGSLPLTIDTGAPGAPAAPTTYADNVGTVQSPASTAATTDDTTPGINIGTVPTGTTPTLYVDGVKVPATYDPVAGTLTPTTPLTDGPHAITYTLTDPAGNESGQSGSLPLTIDTGAPSAPAAPTSYADNVGTVQDPASTALTTDDQTPGINIGTVPAGTTPTLYVDGVAVPATYDPVAGTLTPTTALTDGPHAITYTLTDPAGNESGQSGSLPLTIDTGAPSAPAAPTTYADNVGTVQDPASTALTTDDQTPGINIGTVPAGTTPTLYVDGVAVPATYDPVAGTLTPITALADGPHAITYTLTDAAGNESGQSGSLPLTIDTGAPSAPAAPTTYADNVGTVQDPASTALTTDDQTPGINIGTVPAGTTPTLYVDGVAVPATYDPVAGTLTPTTALTDGPHAITYTLTDPAGNESGQSGSLPLTIDTSGPTVTTTAITIADVTADNVVNAAEGAASVTVTGTLTNVPADAASKTLVLTIGGVAYTAVIASDNSWSVPVAGSDLIADSDTTIDAVATFTDAAGNASTVSGNKTYAVDTSGPTVTTTAITIADVTADNVVNAAEGAASVTVTGTLTNVPADAASKTLVLTIGGVAYTAVIASDNSWSVPVAGSDLIADSDTTIDAVATFTDAAGNASTVSGNKTYAVDTSGPTVTTTAITIADVTADNVVNAAEGAASVTVTGTLTNVPADAASKTLVLTIGGVAYTAVIASDNSWSVPVAGSDLIADSDTTIDAVATFTDAAGNASTVSGNKTYAVNTTASAGTPSVVIFLDSNNDGTINTAEKGTATTTSLTVGVSAAAANGDVITVKNGTTTVATLVVGTDIVAGATATVTGVTLPADGQTLTVTAQIADAVGNPGATATDSAKIDTTASAGVPTVIIALDSNNDGSINSLEKGGATTTSLTVGVSATAVAGDVITVKNGTTTVATLVVGTDIAVGGTATVSGVALPAEGQTLTVTAQIADAVGNPGATATDSAKIDTTASAGTPSVAIALDTNNDSTINSLEKGVATTTSLTVGVDSAAVAGDVITVKSGTTTVATLVVGTDIAVGGTATVNGVALPAEGQTLTVTAQIADAVGNPGATATDSAKIDTTASAGVPTVIIALDSNNDGSINSLEKGGATTTSLTVGVSATAVAGDVITVKNGTTTVATLVVGTDIAVGGTATVSGVALPAEGQTLTVTAQIADAVGNPGATATDSARIDTTAPTASLSLANFNDSFPVVGTLAANQATDSYTTDNLFDLSSTVSDNIGVTTTLYQVSTNGGTSWTTTTAAQSGLVDGTYQYRVTATDAAGNSTVSNTVSVTVDNTKPLAGVILAAGTTKISGTAEANSLVAIDYGNNGSIEATAIADGTGNWSYTFSTAQTPGAVAINVYDLAGNKQATPTTSTTDISAPVITDTLGNANLLDPSKGTSISGKVSDADTPYVSASATAPITIQISIDHDGNGTFEDANVYTTTLTADGAWSITPTTTINMGAVIKAVATDYAGNASAPATVTVGGGNSQVGGAVANGNLGYDIQNVGDFNGDGYDDFAVMAPGGNGSAGSWASYILYGSSQGLPKVPNINNLPGTDGIKIFASGLINDTNRVSRVSGGGDINGDGYSDVVIADDRIDGVVVIFGRASAGLTAPQSVDISLIKSASEAGQAGSVNGFGIWRGLAAGSSAYFGTSAAITDVNNDGYADVVVNDWDRTSSTSSGTYVIYGNSSVPGSTQWHNFYAQSDANTVSDTVGSTTQTTRLTTSIQLADPAGNAVDYRPTDVTAIGDINGDGFVDFAWTNSHSTNPAGTGNAGSLRVIYGGVNLNNNGTIDNDGNAATADTVLSNATYAASATRGFVAYGAQASEYLGGQIDFEAYAYDSALTHAIASGDVNGDGIADLVVGSPDWGGISNQAGVGRVYVIYGKAAGGQADIADISTLAASSNGFAITSQHPTMHDNFGSSVSVGDYNGDGIDDIAIGAPLSDTISATNLSGLVNNGSVYVVYGKAGGYTADIVATPSGTAGAAGSIQEFDGTQGATGGFGTLAAADYNTDINTRGAELGINVTLGDLNGDGIADLGLGSPFQTTSATQDGSVTVLYASPFNMTQYFTTQADTIVGTGGVDRISGGAGNDTITNIGANDVAYGGADNDLIAITSANFQRVDGGQGYDTLRVDSTSSVTLNFANLGTKVQNFDVIDLGTSASAVNGNHTVNLRLSDVLSLTEGQAQNATFKPLKINGGLGDFVDIKVGLLASDEYAISSTTAVDGGVTYNVYHAKLAPWSANTFSDIWVQQGISVI